MFCELTSNPGKYLLVSFQRKSHLPLNVEPEVSAEGTLCMGVPYSRGIWCHRIAPWRMLLLGVSNCRGTGHLEVLHYRGTGYLEIPSWCQPLPYIPRWHACRVLERCCLLQVISCWEHLLQGACWSCKNPWSRNSHLPGWCEWLDCRTLAIT
jgi:hypothetical protein